MSCYGSVDTPVEELDAMLVHGGLITAWNERQAGECRCCSRRTPGCCRAKATQRRVRC
jgi:hypothetical protein